MICLLIPYIVSTMLGGGLMSQQEREKKSAHADVKSDAIVLTEGIVGGFVPAHVRLKVIVLPKKNTVEIWVKSQSDRTAKPRYVKGEVPRPEFEKLTSTIEAEKFWKLPVESPRGSQDIYQLDTSLHVRLGKKSWSNGGPAGCVHGQSEIQASGKQRRFFQQVVEQIKASAEGRAKLEIDAGEFNQIEKKIDQWWNQE